MAPKNRYFADDGWAYWITGDDTSTIYLNEWIDPRKKSFVDIGMRIRGILGAEEINLYVPFPVEKQDVQDISQKLQDRDVFRAVFNATGIMDVQKNACTSEMAYHGKAVDLIHLSTVEFSVRPVAEGTLITVPVHAIRDCLDNDEAYIFFRIPHKSLDEIFEPKINISNFFTRLRDLVTTPVVSEKYGYSVRVNEARLLPDEINRIGAFHRQKLNKAVVTISINENYRLNDANCYRIHRQEDALHENYAPEGFACENIITYEWNQTREVNQHGQFNFYFDISRDAISKSSMFFYMVVLLLVGLLGDVIWDLVCRVVGG